MPGGGVHNKMGEDPPQTPLSTPWSRTHYNGGGSLPNPQKHYFFANVHFQYLCPLALPYLRIDHPINEKLVKVAYTEDDTIMTDDFAIVYR